MWRTIRLFCSKSIERRALFFRASGGTGKTPRRSSMVTGVVFIVILRLGLDLKSKIDRISARELPSGAAADSGEAFENASRQRLRRQRFFIEPGPSRSDEKLVQVLAAEHARGRARNR